jgi:hypothetical protein
MLYLLTVADSMATGPKAWNDWTSSLLRNLFFKVLNVMENGELATGRAVRTLEKNGRGPRGHVRPDGPEPAGHAAQIHVSALHAVYTGRKPSPATWTCMPAWRPTLRVADRPVVRMPARAP